MRKEFFMSSKDKEIEKKGNKGSIIVTVLVIVIIVGLLSVIPIRKYYDQRQVKSAELFYTTYKDIKEFVSLNQISKDGMKDNLMSDLDNVVKMYPGTVAAKRALYYKGIVSYYTLDYKGAEMFFGDFVKKNSNNYLAPKALYFLSYSQSEIGKNEDALKSLSTLVEKFNDGFYSPMAYFRIGMLYERMGKRDKALENYETIIKKYKESSQSENAKSKIMLLKNNIEL